jgi:hypothetical protein
MVGVKSLSQDNVGGGRTTRVFFFLNDKLYRVNVLYESLQVIFEGIVDKFIADYGMFSDMDNDFDVADSWFRWEISPTTSITVAVNVKFVRVEYSNPKIDDEAENLEKKKKHESIKF